jgi:hypothetical protein
MPKVLKRKPWMLLHILCLTPNADEFNQQLRRRRRLCRCCQLLLWSRAWPKEPYLNTRVMPALTETYIANAVPRD